MQKKYLTKMLNNPILLVLLLFPYFKPSSLEYIAPVWEPFFDVLRIFSFVIVLGMYIYNRKISKIILAIIVYEFILLLSTIINNGSYWALAVSCGTYVSLCMLIELYSQYNFIVLSKALLFILVVLYTINIITIIVYPDGMYVARYTQNWFLGYDNCHFPYNFILLFIYSLNYIVPNNKLTFINIVLIALFSASTYITWVAGAVMSISLFLIYIFILRVINFNTLLNINTYIFINAFLFIGFVIFRIQNIFSFIIVNILKKDITFTGRTKIWNAGIYWFLKSPLIGNGVNNVDNERLKLVGFEHCHNYFLQILYRSGILGFLFFIIIIFLVMKKLSYLGASNKYVKFISYSIFCFLILFQVEAYPTLDYFLVIATLAYHIEEITPQLEKYSVKTKMDINNIRYKKLYQGDTEYEYSIFKR